MRSSFERSGGHRSLPRALRGVRGVDALLCTPCADAYRLRLTRRRTRRGGGSPPRGGRARGSGLEPWIPLLGLLLGLDLPLTPETKNLDARFLREQLADVTMRFLFSTLAGHPTMLVIEDVHFMDEATADLLTRFSRAGSSLRQVLLVTHSYPGKSWAPVDSDLRCLSICLLPQPTARMVEIVGTPHRGEPALTTQGRGDRSAARSGNALFLFELLETVRPTGSVDSFPTRSSRWSQERSTGSRRRTGRCFATHRCSVRARSAPALRRCERGGTARRSRVVTPLRTRPPGAPWWSHAVPQHPHSGRGLRGASVPPPTRAARARRQRHRVTRGRVAR